MTQASTLISEARTYAQGMVTAADVAMESALAAAEGIWGAPNAVFDSSGWPKNIQEMNLPDLPPFSDVVFDPGSDPGEELKFQDIPPVVTTGEPVNKAVMDTIGGHSQPNQLDEFRERLIAIDQSVFAGLPPAPPFDVPPEPSAFTVDIPPPPPYVEPPFDGIKPNALGSNSITDPIVYYRTNAPNFINVVNSYVDMELTKLNPEYHAQMARIETQLTKYLDGGTGLNAAVEDAIYARARSKNDAEARRVRDQALADAATRGFTIPTGALLSATQQARQAGADNNATAAREIVVMQAEMEQKNLQFALTTSAGLRTTMVNATLSYMQNLVTLNGQAVTMAQNSANIMVEMYNAAVKKYSAEAEMYKASAQVFQSKIQGALAEAQIYKAQIDAYGAKVQGKQAEVAVFKARIDALTAKAAAYKSTVEAFVSKAQLERLKVDVFQAQVQAYAAQVNSKTAEWQGYSAKIQGDNAKVNAFSAKVQAYATEVQGYKALIDARSEAVKATALTNDARAKQYVAKWDGYKTVVMAKGEIARTKLENQRQELVAFQAETTAKTAKYNADIAYYRAQSDIGISNSKGSAEVSIKNAELEMTYGKTLATLHSANAQIHANLAGAAMAGMNALAVESATTTGT